MKKVSLFFAMIFAVSMAMGQNNIKCIDKLVITTKLMLTQTGNQNSATVSQTGGNGNHLEHQSSRCQGLMLTQKLIT